MTLIRRAQRQFNEYRRLDNELTQELGADSMVCYNPNEDVIEIILKSEGVVAPITQLDLGTARSLRKYLNRVFEGE